MRPVHLIGVGLVLGAIALGALLSVVSYRWQVAAYPEGGAVSPAASESGQDIAMGKAAFEQKCSSCHTIGGGKQVGPDLKGITDQRPHDWLVQFIVAPDQIIASGDPIAAQLVKEYGMPMPNLGISQTEAEDILGYIQTQSGRTSTAPPPRS